MLRKIVLALAVAGATALVVPSLASAEVYLTKAQAEADTEQAVSERYGSEYPGSACRPQGLSRPKAGYAYHRWVCYWADEYRCEGKLLISGSRGRGYFYHRVLSGQRCP